MDGSVPRPVHYHAPPPKRRLPTLVIVALAAGTAADAVMLAFIAAYVAGLDSARPFVLAMPLSLLAAIVATVAAVTAWHRRPSGRWEIASVVVALAYFAVFVICGVLA
jgi:hypothetical protein